MKASTTFLNNLEKTKNKKKPVKGKSKAKRDMTQKDGEKVNK